MTDHRSTFRPNWSSLNRLFRPRSPASTTTEATTSPAPSLPPTMPQVPFPAATRRMLEERFAGQRTPEDLLAAFADGLSGLGGELADMGLRLQSACAESDWSRCGRLLRQLIDKYIRTIETHDPLSNGLTSGERLRDLLVHLLDDLSICLQPATLTRQAEGLADELRQWQPGLALEPLEHQLRLLEQELRQHTQAVLEQRNLMLAVFAQLLDNVTDMISPNSWLYSEVLRLRPLLDDPENPEALHEALKGLREASYRQALLQERMGQAHSAVGEALPELAGQWATFATTPAGAEYVDRVRALPQALAAARNGNELLELLRQLGQDTQRLQHQANELLAAKEQTLAELAQARDHVQQLEQRLRQPAGHGAADHLTGLPAATRLETLLADGLHSNPVLNVAMLAINGLAQCHRELGRRAAQRLQQTFAESLHARLHGDEVLVRLPEGLFILLLPGTSLLAAHDRVHSLQRQIDAMNAPDCRGSLVLWEEHGSYDTQLDRLEAGLPEDGLTTIALL